MDVPEEAHQNNKNTVQFTVILCQIFGDKFSVFPGVCFGKKLCHLFLRTEAMLRKRRESVREGREQEGGEEGERKGGVAEGGGKCG